ncbi:hypothetical protein CspeluHIS016_0110800 [Cutaneotrichosporon spelunceum]|uniref:Anaphase-promoting complex subunit 4-like WD40 domain-containing protein n=1 Tax=Cutaneotrichosporon spelunceum TaxID=1672016 RepID=A0AAD3TPT9_9TREE|nr:hypothetical protein CspeluHIS016_0110800 [Cutaneotrichosporon spelunceum]
MSAQAPRADTDNLADELDDVVLTEDDVEEVIDDDDDDNAVPHDEEEVKDPNGPVIEAQEGEPEAKPDTAISGTFLHTPGSAMFALALHPSFPNPPLAVSGGQDDLGYLFCPLHPTLGSFNRDTFKAIPLRGHEDSVVAAAFSSDGEYVATGGLDGRVRVWRHAQPKRMQAAEGSADAWKFWEFVTSVDAGEVACLKWHPKGPVLSAGCEDGSVWLWSMPSGRTMTVLSSHTMEVTAGVFPPPAGKQLLTASLDSTLVLWNPSAGEPEFKMTVFQPPGARILNPAVHGITSLAVSPNGALIAAGGAGGRIRLIAIARGEVIDIKAEVVHTLEGHGRGEGVEALAFVDLHSGSYGGKGVVLVSAGTDGRVIVWDTTTGRTRAAMAHPEAVTAIACHPAPCQYVVTTACADRTLRTWDMRTGLLLAEHHGHAAAVNCVAVSPALDGDQSPLGLPQAQFIASGGDEGASLLFRI